MCCKKTFLISLVIFLGFSVSLFSQTNFVEHPKNPVFQGTLNSWDAFIVLTGSVNYVDGKYHMYYCGQETPWGSGLYHMDIGYASSDDGITWEKHKNNPILTYDRDNWEKNGFNDVTVLKIDNMWHMWYETLPTNYPTDRSFEVGYASSTDGFSWKKHNEKLNIGSSEGNWDAGFFSVQDVIYDGGKFLMYYLGRSELGSTGKNEIGVAESVDGINWTKDTLNNPIIMSDGPESFKFGMWSLDVTYDKNNSEAPYQMWYTGFNNVDADRVFYAKSLDGKNWIETEEPLFACENFPWATLWPDDMEVCYVDGVYHMWLYGINSSYQSGIGAGVGYFVDASNASKERILYVPTEYAIIQDAINAADSGDVVIIEEGTYNQQFSFKGKAITVGSRYLIDDSTSHIENTIIDGTWFADQDTASIVSFNNGEDSNSVLCGLTLQNGSGTYAVVPDYHDFRFGGAITIDNSGATIRKNIINNCYCISNSWMNAGAAIDCFELPESKTIIIEDNSILNNEASGGNRGFGGAIQCEAINGNLIINKNIIRNNSLNGDQLTGGAGVCVLYSNSDNITISNNYINKNYSKSKATSVAGGIYVVDTKIVKIFNNIISENNCLSSYSLGGGIEIGNWSANSDVKIAKAEIINNTIVNNSVKREGGGIYLLNIEAEIMNNIIRSNNAPVNKQLSFTSMPTLPIVSFSNIEGGFEGEGNIDSDPMFCDSSMCILPFEESLCIDAGNPKPIYNDRDNDPLYPARGTLRNDMGAFGGPHSRWAEMIIIPDDPTSVKGYFEIIPEEYSLEQNYPNPFNPSTTIKYQIPKQVRDDITNVSLKIYDILGREVATLVNEKQKPGFYEVLFNPNDLASGIYFYKLQAGEFIQTKKMLMIK